MKNLFNHHTIFRLLMSITLTLSALTTIRAHEEENLVILDEIAVRNLEIQTQTVQSVPFEKTTFVLGHIESISSLASIVSSRVSGKIKSVHITRGEWVEKGDRVLGLESRVISDNPPVITLIAPTGGFVTRFDLRVGDPVEPDRMIAEIIDFSEMYAVAHLPEFLLSQISSDTEARIKVLAIGDHEIRGKLVRIGTEVDRANGTIPLQFRIKNPELRLRPGMRAEFNLILRKNKPTLAVAKEAVQGKRSSRHVYIKHSEIPNAFLRVPVQTGKQNDRFIEILEGLSEGMEVVGRGAYSLGYAGDGTAISLKEALDAAHGHAHNPDGSEIEGGH